MDAVLPTRRLLWAVLDEEDFGDAVVEAVAFDPAVVLREEGLDEVTRLGASIGLLVNFNACIDNADYESALRSSEYRALQTALEDGRCSTFPVVEAALRAAAASEQLFYEALPAVYAEVCFRVAGQQRSSDV